MKNSVIKYLFVFLSLMPFNTQVFAQLDSVCSSCAALLTDEFMSDGQQYMSILSGEQTAEFNAVFYGGNIYRIASCGGKSENDIVINVYDKYKNLLFSNADYDYTNYWNFEFKSTIECCIEAKFVPGTRNSGFVVIMIGLQK